MLSITMLDLSVLRLELTYVMPEDEDLFSEEDEEQDEDEIEEDEEEDEDEDEAPYDWRKNLHFDYEMAQDSSEEHAFMMLFTAGGYVPSPTDVGGFNFEVTASAFFAMADELTLENIPQEIRATAVGIVFSTLRGYICAAAAGFPAGKLMLPLVDVAEVVARIDAGEADEEEDDEPETPKRARRRHGSRGGH